MQKTLIYLALFLTLSSFCEARAEGFDIGVGFMYVDSPSQEDVSDLGWDVQIGYEMAEVEKWNFGAQLHLLKGWTSKGDVNEDKELGIEDSAMMAYDSQALYLTARPKDWWLQFKLGVVHADYYTVHKDESNVGMAFGVGLVVPSEMIQVHMLDFHHYQVSGESFNVYTISMLVLFYMY